MSRPIASMPRMREYGVEGDDWEPLPWSWAAERLIDARTYWLSTVTADHRPHALPVWGVWNDDEARFCFSCAPGSQKASNLTSNPAVVVAPEDTVECVSLQGVARPVEDDDRRRTLAGRYLAKYRALAADLTREFLLANALFEVVPTRVYAIIEREDEFSRRATRWSF